MVDQDYVQFTRLHVFCSLLCIMHIQRDLKQENILNVFLRFSLVFFNLTLLEFMKHFVTCSHMLSIYRSTVRLSPSLNYCKSGPRIEPVRIQYTRSIRGRHFIY